MMPSIYLILCCLLLLLTSISPNIRIFSSESPLCISWPKYWSFSISLFSEHLGLISFRTDWFDLLAVQGTLKSLVQYHNLKASVFSTQPFLWSNSHIRTWLLDKPWLWLYELCEQSDVSVNMLSRFVIAFLLRNKCLLVLPDPSGINSSLSVFSSFP